MAFTEDLSIFLDDFGVSVTAGAVSALGILDMPTQVVADGMVLTTDYRLTVKTSQFGGLLYGDGISVDGVSYQVREAMKIDDGALTELTLTKLAPDAVALGSQRRELGLGDLSDVDLEDPEPGESLVYNGEKWTDAIPAAGNLDGGTFN